MIRWVTVTTQTPCARQKRVARAFVKLVTLEQTRGQNDAVCACFFVVVCFCLLDACFLLKLTAMTTRTMTTLAIDNVVILYISLYLPGLC